jgi:hypothetical protein
MTRFFAIYRVLALNLLFIFRCFLHHWGGTKPDQHESAFENQRPLANGLGGRQ